MFAVTSYAQGSTRKRGPPLDSDTLTPPNMFERISRRLRRSAHQGAAAFWDQKVQAVAVYWTEHPLVRKYVNESITGVDWVWPLVAFKAGWAYLPFKIGLSIGCGSGGLERAVRNLRICDEIRGLDISRTSVREARRLARLQRYGGISYRVRNCDQLHLPREKYDIVFFHGSLHHIADPDKLLDEVLSSLKPGGFLYVDDYMGPSRDEWTDEHLAHARQEYEQIDKSLRVVPVVYPPLDSIDPSEMIRSSRIMPAIEQRFEIVHDKPYWGNLLFPLFCALNGQELQLHQELIERMINREKQLVSDGVFSSPLFRLVVARRKKQSGEGSVLSERETVLPASVRSSTLNPHVQNH